MEMQMHLAELPDGEDPDFDGKEEEADISMVCTLKTISQWLNPTDPGLMAEKSRKNPVISIVTRCVTEGWPQTIEDEVLHYKKLMDLHVLKMADCSMVQD